MPLYDDPPHSCDIFSVTSSTDAGGGTALTYTSAQAGVPCSINTASATTVALYDQQQIRVSHTIAFLSAVLTTTPARGMKLVGSDGTTYRVEGLRYGKEYGNVPPFTYADVTDLL